MDLHWIPGVANRIMRIEGRNGRKIVAFAGPPSAGKSTCAEALKAEFEQMQILCDVVPMDGYHYDDAVLESRGLRERKGAPEAFDVSGLNSFLARLRKKKTLRPQFRFLVVRISFSEPDPWVPDLCLIFAP